MSTAYGLDSGDGGVARHFPLHGRFYLLLSIPSIPERRQLRARLSLEAKISEEVRVTKTYSYLKLNNKRIFNLFNLLRFRGFQSDPLCRSWRPTPQAQVL